jgi:putative ABC transport system permease protein
MTQGLMADTIPELGIVPEVAAGTLATAVVLGVVAVALAPLLTVRKLRRMDIPSTLRVVE